MSLMFSFSVKVLQYEVLIFPTKKCVCVIVI